MKKSEIYHLAQMAVLNTATISPENKLEIIKELMEGEEMALYREGLEVKEG